MTLRSRLVLPRSHPSPRPASLLGWLRAAMDRARQRHRLAELDERLLRDIGLTQGQAQAESEKPFWRVRQWE
jgi:uncharacterized protein YjiS (DUF1127 family)